MNERNEHNISPKGVHLASQRAAQLLDRTMSWLLLAQRRAVEWSDKMKSIPETFGAELSLEAALRWRNVSESGSDKLKLAAHHLDLAIQLVREACEAVPTEDRQVDAMINVMLAGNCISGLGQSFADALPQQRHINTTIWP